ncbi:MAG TPA: hypothetical protein VGI95_03670 [Caulobacteraceae bacterium]|jgi:hypothetical protein
MNTLKATLLSAGALATFAAANHANAAPVAGTVDAQTQALSQIATSPGPDHSVNLTSGLQFSATQANSNATLTLQSPLKSWLSGSAGSGGSFSGDAYNFSLAVSTPLAKSADSTNLASLSGLATSTNVTFQFQGYHGSGFIPLGGFGPGASATCFGLVAKYEKKYPVAFHAAFPNPEAVFNDYKLDPTVCEQADVEGLIKSLKAQLLPADAAALDAAYQHDPDEAQLQAFSHNPAPVLLYGLSGTVGYEAHSFLTSPTLAKATENKWPVQVGGYLTRVSATGDSALTGQIAYQSAFTDKTSKTLCPAGPAPVTCVTGSLGPPSHDSKLLIAAEWRWFGRVASLPSFGVDPMVTYDALSGAYAFDLPVYLLNDATHNLTGGIRVDWTSVKHRTVVGVFVTKAFNIAGRTTPTG